MKALVFFSVMGAIAGSSFSLTDARGVGSLPSLSLLQ